MGAMGPMGMLGAWVEMLRGLGQALIELAKAELAALGEEYAASGRRLATAIALLGVAAIFLFWTVAALLYTAVQVLAIWLRPWAAGAVVTGFCLLLVAIVLFLALRKLRGIESPARVLERRMAEHREWWNERLLAGADAAPVAGDGKDGEEPDDGEELS